MHAGNIYYRNFEIFRATNRNIHGGQLFSCWIFQLLQYHFHYCSKTASSKSYSHRRRIYIEAQNYRWQNEKLHSSIGWLQNSIVKISRNTKFWQNYLEFHKIGGKFCETWNSKFRKSFAKFSQPPYSYTISRLKTHDTVLLTRPGPSLSIRLLHTILVGGHLPKKSTTTFALLSI